MPSEKILVVGDLDPQVAAALVAAGYGVTLARSEQEALDKFAGDEALKVVVFGQPPIADMTVFTEALHATNRDGLVIVGYGSAEQRDEFRRHAIRLFLEAPWVAEGLVSLVRARRLTMGLMNLHDAFLTASLAKVVMDGSPLVSGDAEVFTMSDRGRAERLWVALLAVLVEAWDSGKMREVRDFVRAATDTSTLIGLVREARKTKMREVRGYMFHRDERGYWDAGRTAVFGQLGFFTRLHEAFSVVFRAAMKAWRPRSSAEHQQPTPTDRERDHPGGSASTSG
jgi:hypothetical protein